MLCGPRILGRSEEVHVFGPKYEHIFLLPSSNVLQTRERQTLHSDNIHKNYWTLATTKQTRIKTAN